MSVSDTQKSILLLLSDGEFHSGTEIATVLNMTRSAIWKQLNSLNDLGISYSAISGKGYRLNRPLHFLEQSKILAAVSEPNRSLIRSLEIHEQIPSTNTHLVERALHNAPSGTICFAEQQTAGKGRRGRQWVSPYGSNIYLSILWRFQSSPTAISGLSLAIGVAVIRALNQLYSADFQLKWPNDIYYQGKKLGGILVEVSGESEGPCVAVIGLGINVFLPETEAVAITQLWTDLTKIISQQPVCRNTLAGTLLNQLFLVIKDFEDLGITPYLNEWRQYDCFKDKPAKLFIGQHCYEGIIQGIDDQGFLLLSRPDGHTQAFASGEISFNNDASEFSN